LHGTAVLGPLFYLGVLIVAATGSSQAAVHWLGWELWLTVPAVLLAEVGGVYLSAMADEQRRDGEHAFAARILSTAVAVGAVMLNWFGHREHIIQAGFFAGMSALGYAVWLIQAGRRRRKRLREEGKLADTPPSYGPIQWLQHPFLTARARTLAKDSPGMGRVESLEAVRLQGALADFIRQEIIQSNAGPDGKAVDGEKVEALLAIYDPVSMARELRARVQWDEFADALAARIDPRRVLAKPSMPRTPAAPLPRPAAARGRARQQRPPRRNPAETAAEAARLQREQPGITMVDLARQLGYTGDQPDRGLRAALNAARTTSTGN
jgi:hypothetical protein